MSAALFPGQGSQHIGMGKSLFDEFSEVRHLFEEASDQLHVNFKKLCFDGPDSELALTENTQPCLLLVSYATFVVAQESLGFAPTVGIGHSLGEYSALVAAGTLKFGDAMSAVKSRGKFMQEAVPLGKGGMAAVMGLTDEEVRKLCQWAEEEFGEKPLEPANFNSPGQIVISGNKTAVEKLLSQFAVGFDSEKVFGGKKRVKLIPLNVSAPFHCSMMKVAEDKMSVLLKGLQFQNPAFPIVQNFTAKEEVEPQRLQFNVIKQISSPVLWTQSVKRLKDMGEKKLLECGPGKVLSGLVKKIDSELLTFNIQTLEDIRNLEKDTKWLA